MNPQKRIQRLALIGLGSIGRRHLRLLKGLRPDIEVILVRSGQGSRWPEEALAVGSVSTIEEAIDLDINAAIISSPAPFHVNQSIQLINAGVPLLIEKPLSNNLDQTQQLKILAENTGVTVLVGYVLRYSLALQHFYKMLIGNAVGRVIGVNIDCGSYLPEWRPGQDYRTTASARQELGGGVLLELSHELDYANWLFGPFKSVDASVINSGALDIQVEDTADLELISENDVKVVIHLDFLRRQPIRQCVVLGSEGNLTWNGINNEITLYYDNGETKKWAFNVERDDMFRAQLKHFFKCVEKGELPKVNLTDGIAALEIIEAAKCSQIESKVIHL